MLRELYMLVMLGVVLTILRIVILFVLEQYQRLSYRRQFGQDAESTVETHIASWRRKTGRWLWINFVGLSFGVFCIILFIAQLG